MTDFIYSLYDPLITKCYKLDIECRKIGSTKYINSRMKVYQTGYADKVPLECYYEISTNIFNCYDVDEMLKIYFNDYRLINMKSEGGTEFYDANKLTLDVLEDFFNKHNINYLKKNGTDIINQLNNRLTDKEKKNIQKEDDIKYQSKENKLRNFIQNKYLIDIRNELNIYKKCFIKAPTGFGKTHIFYKIIKEYKYDKILILTPRILLNEQIVETKYSHYVTEFNYEKFHYSNEKNLKEQLIEKLSQYNSNEKNLKGQLIEKLSQYKGNFIMTSCYQSCKNLMMYIKKYNLIFDVIIFDEAHFITSWINKINNCIISSETEENNEYNSYDFIFDDTISKYKIFGSATPTEEIEMSNTYFGNIIEKVKVHELINYELLCDIETIVKHMNNRKEEYHNLKDLIVETMIKYKKKKGIIYVNNCTNAEKIYELMKEQTQINCYIYISKELQLENEDVINIKKFEADKKQCIIIVVGKLGYGYDNDYIDFICLGDPRQSDIDIRQILGRGLRWNKDTYPNKLLHLLVPLYKEEFGNLKENLHLKKYLDYIIGECDKDIIIQNGMYYIGNGKNKKTGSKTYNGEPVELELLTEYCTTGNIKFSKFEIFLKINNIYEEKSYNKLKELNEWMPNLGPDIVTKYPHFCFRNIYPNNKQYYWNKIEAEQAYELCDNELINIIGKDKWKRYNSQQKLIKINELDNKIPIVNFNLYYPL
jgi:superfamily II DNA or RNA helicase